MRKQVMVCAAILVATNGFAQQAPAANPLDEKTEALVRQSLPVCADLKLTQSSFETRMPAGMTASLIRADSTRGTCAGQYLAITTKSGSFYLGMPWMLDGTEGTTLEEKLRNFAWTRMQESFTAVVDRQRTRDGLYRVTLNQTTERGRVPLQGLIDPDGKIFFMGDVRAAGSDAATTRLKAFESIVAGAPSRGAEKPEITIVEFSDFQCPSCKYAAGYLDPILEKHGHQVRYVRYDLPLIGAHPWAFAAALAGRAIHRQKPDVFWQYKKHVYENQDKLTAFTFDDFARAFAQDHELNMERYDADVSSPAIRDELLKGVGLAFSNEVRATPTFMVNGVFVDAGDKGGALESYVAGLAKK